MDYKDLLEQAQAAAKGARELVEKAEGRDMTSGESEAYKAKFDEATRLKADSDREKGYADDRATLKMLSEDDGDAPTDDELAFGGGAKGRGRAVTPKAWASTAAKALTGLASRAAGTKALTSGSYTLPAVMVDAVSDPQVARSLLQLIPQREQLQNNFGYLRQTVRENNAAPVADNALKPTSVFTFDEVEDRCRVVAHLSEPFPQRYLQDHTEAVALLEFEMAYGVLTALEEQVLSGDGTGENITGVLSTTGVSQVAFATDAVTTLRRARTALDVKEEAPSAWVFHPADAEALDLLRENGTTGDFLTLNRVLGTIPFVTSNAVPAGQALLGDWRQVQLLVRESSRIDVNTGGDDLFKKNQVMLRAEMRLGFYLRRPQALAVVDLTAA